jgi:hypothetical protein
MDEEVDFCRECGSGVHWIWAGVGNLVVGWWEHDREPPDQHDARAPVPDQFGE